MKFLPPFGVASSLHRSVVRRLADFTTIITIAVEQDNYPSLRVYSKSDGWAVVCFDFRLSDFRYPII